MNDSKLGITKENLLLIVPPALTHDPAMMARAAADAEAMAARLAEIDRVRIISNIDGLNETVLDILARDFKVDWYDPNYSLEEKRRTVKSSWRVHKTLGTKAAVETAIRAIYPLTTVEEWFEYGGEPYWFKIKTNALMTEDMLSFFSDMIRRVKNTRSHIQAIEIHRTIEQTLYAGACADPHYRPAPIIDGYEVGRQIDQTIHAGATAFPEYKPAAIIDGYEEARTSGNVVHAGTAEASQTRQEAVREALSFEGEEIHTEPLKTGTAATGTTKPAAIIDGYRQEGETVEAIARSAGTAAGEGAAKPAAIIDGYRQEAEAVKESIFAGLALNSRYTKTIVREGGSDDATTI